VEGLSNTEVAEKIFLSANTVKKHVSKILEKLHTNNRVEAAVLAVRKKLLD
jgi:DNA-binding NarL/FixJ family response regulator